MLSTIRSYFDSHIKSAGQPGDERSDEKRLQLAAASLLIEISRADFEISDAERQEIVCLIESFFKLSRAETDEIVHLAESELEDATCLFEFTQLINEQFSYEEKCELVEMMWRVCYSDGIKDKYEEHILRRVAELIYVDHGDFIRLRHKVESE